MTCKTSSKETTFSQSNAAQDISDSFSDHSRHSDNRLNRVVVGGHTGQHDFEDYKTTSGVENAKEKDTKSEEKTKNKLKFSQMSRRSKYTCVMLAVASFAGGCGFSLPAPFFPREAAKKGATPTEVGLVFSCFQLVTFLTAPLIGNYLTKIGAKFAYTSGILVAGTTAILFGFLDQGPSGTPFVAMSFLVRAVEALGVSAFTTASFAIISNEFPSHVASVFAALEGCVGVGLMIGPTFGGALYEVGGFGLSFWVVGGVMVVSGLLLFTCLPVPHDNGMGREGSVLSLLRSPMVWTSASSILVGACGIGFFDPTLSSHLDKFGLSTLSVGLYFVIVPAAYAMLAPLYGFLSDTKDLQAPLLIGGNTVACLGFLCVGPTPLLSFLPQKLWLVTFGLILYGVSIGCAIVPTMKCLVIGAKELGLPEGLNTFGLVSGLFNSVFCLGAFIGPTIGGFLQQEVGFCYAATIIAGLYCFTALVSSAFFGMRRLRRIRTDVTSSKLEVPDLEKVLSVSGQLLPHTEKSPLLNGRSQQSTSLVSDSFSSASFSQVNSP